MFANAVRKGVSVHVSVCGCLWSTHHLMKSACLLFRTVLHSSELNVSHGAFLLDPVYAPISVQRMLPWWLDLCLHWPCAVETQLVTLNKSMVLPGSMFRDLPAAVSLLPSTMIHRSQRLHCTIPSPFELLRFISA